MIQPEIDTICCSYDKRNTLGKRLTIATGDDARTDAITKACSVRILIVEDDAAMARGLAERLKLSGFAVDSCA